MASIGKSKNSYYRNDDLKRPFDNIKEAMGLTGNADSNYYTNLGKVSRYEGSELDNTGKRGTLDALGQVLATMMKPGMEKQRYQEHLGLTGKAENYAESRTTDDLRPDLVTKGGFQADEAGGKAEFQQMLNSLAEQISKYGEPDIADYAAGPGGGGSQYADAIKGSQEDFEQLVRKIGALKGVGNAPLTAKQRSDREGSDVKATNALADQRKASEEAIRDLGVVNVAVANKRVAEIAASMKNAGQLTKAKLKAIEERLLLVWQESFYRNGTELKRGDKLDQTIKTEIQKTLGAEQDTEKKTNQAEMSQMEKDELHQTLSFKREILRQKKRKASSLAEIAAVDELAAQQLKTLEIEIQKLEKGIKTAGKDKSEAQKDRAITLSEMSTIEKNALKPEILAKAQKLEGEIRKDEATILKIQAQTQTEQAARQLKITQNRLNNNKDIIQKLLSPHLQKFHKERAANEAGQFAQQTALKMTPPAKAKKPLGDKGKIDNWFFETSKDEVPNMRAEPYNKMRGEIFELFSSGKTKFLDKETSPGVTPRTGILKRMIQQLGINKNQATQVLEQWLNESKGE